MKWGRPRKAGLYNVGILPSHVAHTYGPFTSKISELSESLRNLRDASSRENVLRC